MREHGYVEGRDFDIAYKFADGFFDRLPALAEELVRLRPDAVFAATLSRRLLPEQLPPLFPSYYVLSLKAQSGWRRGRAPRQSRSHYRPVRQCHPC
jgi:putative ABC transport system substrate-binding protein